MKYFNYPFNALEEAVVNAVFHKSYRDDSPVEIRIYVDEIVILNYPGPAKWIDMDKFAQGKVRARKYRNRRIGEFFKELDLSEKQSTGIPTILAELKKNGSSMPEFETDDERNYLETTIRIRAGFDSKSKVSDKVSDKMSDKQKIFYSFLMEAFKSSEFVTTKIMTEYSDMAESTTRRYLNQFCEMQIIKSDGKKDTTKKGMIGELLVHLLVKYFFDEYEIISPFLNMEERSIKKGYDAVLTEKSNPIIWLIEVNLENCIKVKIQMKQ